MDVRKSVSQVVVDPKTGFSDCKDCLAGSHNPNPAISHQCVCKPHLEPDGTGACLPCQPGWFKSDFHSHDVKCVKCPDDKKSTGRDGGKRCVIFLVDSFFLMGLAVSMIARLEILLSLSQ